MKVIRSLENRGILLKGTTRKITSHEGGFLNFLRPLMTTGLPLMKSVPTPLAKSVLLPLGLSAGMPAADAAIQKKVYGSGHPSDLASHTTALIISNEEMEDIMKIVSETIRNKTKEQKGEFLPMLLGTLAARLLGSALIGRGVIRAAEGRIRAGQNFYCRLIL